MGSGKIILGTLAGVTAGAVLGMLLAPEKGSELRRTISHKGEEYADALKSKIDNIADSMNKKIDTYQDKAIDWLESRKDRMHMHDMDVMKGNNI